MKRRGFYTKEGVSRHTLYKSLLFLFLLHVGRDTAVPILSATQSLRLVTVDALQSDALAIRLALRCCLYRVGAKSTCAATCDTLAVERYVLVTLMPSITPLNRSCFSLESHPRKKPRYQNCHWHQERIVIRY